MEGPPRGQRTQTFADPHGDRRLTLAEAGAYGLGVRRCMWIHTVLLENAGLRDAAL